MQAALLLVLLFGACLAQGQSINIVSGRIDAKIRPDATTQVMENLTLDFEGKDFTYGRRNIFCGVKGRASDIAMLSVSINDLPYNSSRRGSPGSFDFQCSADHCTSYAPDCTAEWYFETPRRGSLFRKNAVPQFSIRLRVLIYERKYES
jgi:hypothetical protein